MSDPQSIFDLFLAVSVFGLILAVWVIFVLLRSTRRSAKAKKVERRLELAEQELDEGRVLRLWHDGKEATTTVPLKSRQGSLWQRLDRLRHDAGWEVPLQTILLGLVGVMLLLSAVVLFLSRNWPAAVGAAAATLMSFWIYLGHRIGRREGLFERQFLDAMGLACRSLRAGHPLTGAFVLIADEIGPPVGNTFAEICQQQALGMSLENALRSAAATSNSPDMRMFATSVIIQLRSGGNLADMMDRLALVIRDRMRLNRRVRILTAQTQFSKRILLALPILLFAVLNAMNPAYMRPLYTTTLGRTMSVIAASGLLFGAWIMNRMAKLRY